MTNASWNEPNALVRVVVAVVVVVGDGDVGVVDGKSSKELVVAVDMVAVGTDLDFESIAIGVCLLLAENGFDASTVSQVPFVFYYY